jgi:hypothetical protein
MNYAVLVYVRPDLLIGVSAEDKRSLHGEHQATVGPVSVVAHYTLRPPRLATTIRVRQDKIEKTRGPATEAGEGLRALYVVESEDQDAVLEFAGRLPAVRLGGTAEVWPLIGRGVHADPGGGHGWRGRH